MRIGQNEIFHPELPFHRRLGLGVKTSHSVEADRDRLELAAVGQRRGEAAHNGLIEIDEVKGNLAIGLAQVKGAGDLESAPGLTGLPECGA